MGCTSSKLDDLPAVALCRHRCSHLDDAVRHRYALAEAHMAYINTLKTIARSMHDFLDPNFDPTPLSPVLNLPNQRKGEPVDPGHIQVQGRLSDSDSGSHLHFHSEDESDGSGSGHLHDSGHSSPLHSPSHRIEYMNPNPQQGMGPYQGGFLHMNYMKKRATPPTVVYEQRPMSHQTVHVGESSSSSSYYPPYPYSTPNQAAPYPYYGHGGYGGGAGDGGGYGYPSSGPPNYPYSSSSAAPPMLESSSKPPPPPPSPPKNSTLDFLNFFDVSYDDRFYTQYTPSRDSRDVREEEGIPDLEDDDYHEVVKEVHGRPKFVDSGNYTNKGPALAEVSGAAVAGGGHGGGEASVYQKRPAAIQEENHEVEYEVHVVDKKVVDDGDRRKSDEPRAGDAAGSKVFRGANEVVREIELQFERASESGNEIASMLEVGKFPYRRKHHVTSKMVRAVTPPLSVSSKASTSTSTSTGPEPSSASEASGPSYMEEDVGLRSRNLSSTLHKLYLWEKKLYNEVKAEEKMRIVHDRKVQKLKRLDQRGAEAAKVDATRTLIRSLSTKIRMAIQVVDKMSITINKIRDEELWPQLSELLQGLTRMWKCMLECHQIQCQAIGSARGLGPIGSGKMVSDVHLEATLQFEGALINWTFRFANWISAQKGFIKSLNEWLLKCLLYEPEETADGIVPFSPGRIGAPPIFVLCHQWAQSLDRISEKEVLDAMREFVTGILQMWRHDKHEMRERMVTNKDLEKKVKILDKKDQKIQKEVQALEKKVVLFNNGGGGQDEEGLSLGQVVYPGDASRNLQSSLQKIFAAMEKFMDSSSRAYEELLQRCEEEERMDRERRSAS